MDVVLTQTGHLLSFNDERDMKDRTAHRLLFEEGDGLFFHLFFFLLERTSKQHSSVELVFPIIILYNNS